jgi:hypothetical protein
MEEETGLRVAVKRKVAEIWFNGNRQEYFLVERIGGEFGPGSGEEYENFRPEFGTYHPLWMPVSELLDKPVLPVEMVRMVIKSVDEGWPREPVVINESSNLSSSKNT